MTESEPQSLIALFNTLATATEAMYAVQAAGVPYANLTLESHNVDDVAASVAKPIADDDGLVWSLAVLVGEPLYSKAVAALRTQPAFALGQQDATLGGRDVVERGRTAWGHYVFAAVAASDQVGEGAGTVGTTGVTSSGVFASGSHSEAKPATPNVKDAARG